MIWSVLLPFAAATLAFVLGPRSHRAIAIAAPPLILLSALEAVRSVWLHGPQELAWGGWEAPLGIVLRLDGLAALMLLMTSAVLAPVSLYALRYMDHASFWPLWLFLWGTLHALFLSGDVFNLYVVLELLTIAGVALVLLAGPARAVAASTRYLMAAFFGSMLYLLGVALLYGEFGALDLLVLQERMMAGPAADAALVLMSLGLLIKSALLPFHTWLPRAHANAPSPVSAALSALVVMGSMYLVLRLWSGLFLDHAVPAVAQAVGVLGAAAIVWGSVQALRQERLKLVLAYSTVAHMGYLFLAVPLLASPGPWRSAALAAVAFQALSHAFAKASLFLTAGVVIRAIGHDRVRNLAGLSTTMPMATFTLGLGGAAIIGIPPSGVFAAKWQLLVAALLAGQWWWAIVVAGGTLLAAAYVFRVLRITFLDTADLVRRPVPRTLTGVALALAVVAILLGFASGHAFTLITGEAP